MTKQDFACTEEGGFPSIHDLRFPWQLPFKMSVSNLLEYEIMKISHMIFSYSHAFKSLEILVYENISSNILMLLYFQVSGGMI